MIRKLALVAAVAFIPASAMAQGQGSPNGLPEAPNMNAPAMKGFQEYVVRQNVRPYTYNQEVAVGTVLPAQGVTYYEVPAEYGMSQYRYTVVNNRTVLVDPQTRRVVTIVR